MEQTFDKLGRRRPPPTKKYTGYFRTILTKEFLEQQHHVLRKSIIRIAREVGCSDQLVWLYMRQHGVPRLKDALKTGRPSNSPTRFKPGAAPWNKGMTGIPAPNRGKKFPRGAAHWNWKGGPKPDERAPRMRDPLYRDWRKAVYERDDYTCQGCGQRGGRLNADHIQAWATHPDLRYELSNGRTLCLPCHRATPTYGWASAHAKRVMPV